MSKNDKGFDRLIADYMRELFDERGVSQTNREKLWKKYYDKLAKAVDVGYSPKLKQYDPQLAHSLKYNIAKFSAFKETSFKAQLEAMLTKNGKIVPWSEFKKKAFAVSGDYNNRWLKTEYHQTVATANMAGKWKDFERHKDIYPNLKYVTAGDSRVRDKHAAWDGLVLPIDHPWWKEHLPPNDWGCRCNVVQTDEEVTKDIPSAQPKPGFDNNAALSGEVFPEIPYKKGMDADAVKEAEALALSGYLKVFRIDIKSWAEKHLLTKELVHPALKPVLKFSNRGIRHFINQPYKHYLQKGAILRDISNNFQDAEYMGYSIFKAKKGIRKSYIFQIKVEGDFSWLIFREAENGDINFYSISDNINVTKNLIK